MASSAPPNFEERLRQYRQEISGQGTEAGIAYLFLELIRSAFSQVNADYLSKLYPEIEKSIRFQSKTLAIRGRMDAFLGNVIIEFKMKLDDSTLKEAIEELKKYVAALWSQQGMGRIKYIVMATSIRNR